MKKRLWEPTVNAVEFKYEPFINIHYRSKVWGHLKMSLFLKEKHSFFNEHDIKLIRNTV